MALPPSINVSRMVAAILGGCFVPTLVFLLWIGGALGPKCPSPCAKAKDADIQMTSIETAR